MILIAKNYRDCNIINNKIANCCYPKKGLSIFQFSLPLKNIIPLASRTQKGILQAKMRVNQNYLPTETYVNDKSHLDDHLLRPVSLNRHRGVHGVKRQRLHFIIQAHWMAEIRTI